MEKKEEVGEGCCERKSLREKQEFRVMMVSYWLSCWGKRFNVHLFLLGPVIGDSFLLIILLESVTDRMSYH